jgi:hypothetical protein
MQHEMASGAELGWITSNLEHDYGHQHEPLRQMFGSRPFREPALILAGATVFALLFEAVSLLVDFVATGELYFTLNSLWFFVSAFLGYVLVALLIRRADARGPASPGRGLDGDV